MSQFLNLFLILLTLGSTIAYADTPSVANYIGTGNTPRLVLELATNGSGWNTYQIDYGQQGKIPCNDDPKKNWSAWNIKDDKGLDYGTINLSCTGYAATFSGYHVNDKQETYLVGIHFDFNKNIQSYQLSVDQIHTLDQGPFPDAPLATPAVNSKTGKLISFHTQGSQILNEDNQIVLLKGLVRPSLEWNPEGQFFSPTDIQNMKHWGANTIRLDLNQNYWFASGPATQKGSYKQIINAIVYYAIQNHMAVIFDLHWTVDGSQSPMANQDSIRFWKALANDYQNFGSVIFELYNEPFGINADTWLNGNTEYAGYQSLYNAVRSTGAKNLCIINGLDYGYDLSFVNNQFGVQGFNIIYGSHPYNEKGAANYTGPGGSFENNFKGFVANYPLIFTEFGVNSENYFPNGYQSVYQRIIAYANAEHINYTAFAWWVEPNHPNIFPALISDWSGTPLNGGQLVHDDLNVNPGSEI